VQVLSEAPEHALAESESTFLISRGGLEASGGTQKQCCHRPECLGGLHVASGANDILLMLSTEEVQDSMARWVSREQASVYYPRTEPFETVAR
jgi:hypothetical protein